MHQEEQNQASQAACPQTLRTAVLGQTHSHTQIAVTWISDNNQYQTVVQDKPGIITYRQALVCAA